MNTPTTSSTSPPIITCPKLRELLTTLTSPKEKLQNTVDLALIRIADDLAIQVSSAAAQLASYRRKGVIEARDILYAAEHLYGIKGLDGVVDNDEEQEKNIESGAEDLSNVNSVAESPAKRGRKASSSIAKKNK